MKVCKKCGGGEPIYENPHGFKSPIHMVCHFCIDKLLNVSEEHKQWLKENPEYEIDFGTTVVESHTISLPSKD